MEREYEVSFKIRSNHPVKPATGSYANGSGKAIQSTDGQWYTVPSDATIKDVSSLPQGYYIIDGSTSVYRYILAYPDNRLQHYNGVKWVDSDSYTAKNEDSWRDKLQYIGPLDSKNESV